MHTDAQSCLCAETRKQAVKQTAPPLIISGQAAGPLWNTSAGSEVRPRRKSHLTRLRQQRVALEKKKKKKKKNKHPAKAKLLTRHRHRMVENIRGGITLHQHVWWWQTSFFSFFDAGGKTAAHVENGRSEGGKEGRRKTFLGRNSSGRRHPELLSTNPNLTVLI